MKRSGVQRHVAIATSIGIRTGQMQSLGMSGGHPAKYVTRQPDTHALVTHVASHCHTGCAQNQADQEQHPTGLSLLTSLEHSARFSSIRSIQIPSRVRYRLNLRDWARSDNDFPYGGPEAAKHTVNALATCMKSSKEKPQVQTLAACGAWRSYGLEKSTHASQPRKLQKTTSQI